jgi:hypothetical protein
LSLLPVYLGIECKEKGVSKDEMVLPYASEVELHLMFLISLLNLKPTVLGDLSLLVFCSIYIVDDDWLR